MLNRLSQTPAGHVVMVDRLSQTPAGHVVMVDRLSQAPAGYVVMVDRLSQAPAGHVVMLDKLSQTPAGHVVMVDRLSWTVAGHVVDSPDRHPPAHQYQEILCAKTYTLQHLTIVHIIFIVPPLNKKTTHGYMDNKKKLKSHKGN